MTEKLCNEVKKIANEEKELNSIVYSRKLKGMDIFMVKPYLLIVIQRPEPGKTTFCREPGKQLFLPVIGCDGIAISIK
ncbi:MAG: hypothetical protein ACFWUE_06275 [Xylanivirga thermophila]|jgi:hypothetical protein|uniref:hypothetical protein n=1 Tax=Xylanivirga thermophila TaxID=2496273 RepID=UPI0039F63DA2